MTDPPATTVSTPPLDTHAAASDWFGAIVEGLGEALTVQDVDGRLVYANAEAARLVGAPSPESLLGAGGAEAAGRFELFDEEGRSLPVEGLPGRRVLGTGVAEESAVRFRSRDTGEERWALVRARPLRDAAGRVTAVLNVFRDVTRERRAEARRGFLERASEELGLVADYHAALRLLASVAVPEVADWAAVDVAHDGVVERLAAAHVDPAKVGLVTELARRHPPDPEAPRGALHVLRTGRPEFAPEVSDEDLEAAASGAEHLALLRGVGLRSHLAVPLRVRGRTAGVLTLAMAGSGRRFDADDLALATALADRAAVAVENARLVREAQLASRAKDEFLAMLGHELRNPLAPIVTALELMKLRGGGALARERAVVERQVRHMAGLVDDLLDVARITRGEVALKRARVDVAEVVQRAVETASTLLEERGHRLAVDAPGGLAVWGDPARLAQVVANLLANAARYTPKGGHVEVSAARAGDAIEVRVRDDGAGIAPEMQSRIFDLFVQGGRSLDRAEGGLGLGLTIVRSLVALHGGSVSVASEGPGRGSEFRVRLPALDEGADAAAKGDARREAPRPGARVLVVDDNADAADMLAEALAAFGYDVAVAYDGPAALALAPRHEPAAAILDIGLPVMDGHELARRLRELPGLGGVKLVAATGYGQAADLERSRAAGFDAHLVKPLDLDTLRATVERLLGG